MVQIRWENISEKAQIFRFPKLIEILQCDKYFLKKVKICPLGGLIHAHHLIMVALATDFVFIEFLLSEDFKKETYRNAVNEPHF